MIVTFSHDARTVAASASTTRKSRGTSVTARRPFRAIERTEGSCRIERERATEGARVGERAEGRQMANISQLAWVAVYPMAKTRAEILCRLAGYVSLRTAFRDLASTFSRIPWTFRRADERCCSYLRALPLIFVDVSSTGHSYTLGSGGRNDYAAQRDK